MRKTEKTNTKKSVKKSVNKLEKENKEPVRRKSSKVLDIRQYRVYLVVQQLFKGTEQIIEEEIILYGKDEDIEFHHTSIDVANYWKRVKGFIAIPKGSQMPKQFKNMESYNKALKKIKGAMRIS